MRRLLQPALERGDGFVEGLHVAEDGIEIPQGRVVLLVGIGREHVMHHDHLEVQHHGVARRALAADIGGGAADEHGVDPAPAQMGDDVRRPRQECAEALLHDLRVLGFFIELGPERVSFVREIHGGVAAVAALRRVQPVVKHAPAFARVVGGVLDPHHVSAKLAHGGGEAVDRRHDGARLRHLALEARLHEVVLHVDHHEGGIGRLDHVEGMRPAAPAPGSRMTRSTRSAGIDNSCMAFSCGGLQQCSNFCADDARPFSGRG